MAGVYRRLNPRRAQLRRSWAATKSAGNVYTKSGYGILGIPRTWPKMGYGIAGSSGSGQKQAILTKTGRGVAIGGGVGANSTAPSTPVLDNFNRTDGALGSNWSGPVIHPSSLAINLNRVTGAVSGVANGVWNVNTFGPITTGRPVEAYWQLTTVGSPGHSNTLLMVANPTGSTTTGYAAVVNNAGITLFRIDIGSSTQIDSTGITISAGTWAWFIYRPGGAIELWLSTDFITWQKRSFTTDTTYQATPFYIGGQFDDNFATSDNFGGGSVGVLLGSKQVTHTKSGYATAGGIGSGPKQTDHNRTGSGTLGVPALSPDFLDDFNRANGSLGSNYGLWQTDRDPLLISSNQVKVTTQSTVATGIRNDTVIRDATIELEMPVVPTTSSSNIVGIVARATPGGSFTSPLCSGYIFQIDGSGTVAINYLDSSGGSGTIDSASGVTVSNGDAIRAVLRGISLQLWVRQSGVWSLKASNNNSLFAQGAVGLTVRDTTAGTPIRIDNFSFTAIITKGVIGSGFENKIDQDTGYASAGGIGSGTSQKVTGAGNVYTKSGFATVGLIGSGPRQTDHIRSGYAIAGGLIGSGSRQTDHIRSGNATAGLIGAGPSASIFVESGFSTVGGVGSGSKAIEHTRSGYGTVGGVASGLKQTTHTRSGYGVAGSIGSGPDVDLLNKSGYATVGGIGSGSSSHSNFANELGSGIAGLIGSGPSESIVQRTGEGTVGLIGSGSRAVTHTKSGFATVGGIGSGSKQTDHIRSGFGIAGSIGSGSKQTTHAKSGFGTVGTVGAGTKAASYARTGNAIVGLIGAGSSARAGLVTKTGFGSVGGIGSGSDQVTQTRSGFGVAGSIGSGSKQTTHTKSGYATVGGVGSGSRQTDHIRSGNAIVGLIGSGSETKAAGAVKTGFATAGGIGSGSKQITYARSGYAIAGTVGAGSSASIFVETGFAIVGTVGAGSSSRATIYTKSGFATVGDVGSGSRITDHPRSGYAVIGTVGSGSEIRAGTAGKSGHAITSLVGSGTKQTIHLKSGYASVGTDGTGQRQFVYVLSGYGTVGTIASGSKLRRTPFSILVVEVHAYRHWSYTVLRQSYEASAYKHVTLVSSRTHFRHNAFRHTSDTTKELVYR